MLFRSICIIVNKKISTIQRFLTLLFTDKDIGDVVEVSETPEKQAKNRGENPKIEEKIVKVSPEDI